MTPLSAEERAEALHKFICSCNEKDCPRVEKVAQALREAEAQSWQAAIERASQAGEAACMKCKKDALQQVCKVGEAIRSLKRRGYD